jgi:hypothetical protein
MRDTYKAKDRVTRTPLKTGGELRCSGRLGSEVRVAQSVFWVFCASLFAFSSCFIWSLYCLSVCLSVCRCTASTLIHLTSSNFFLLYLHLKQFALTETFEFVENKRLGRVTLNCETVEFLNFFRCMYITSCIM